MTKVDLVKRLKAGETLESVLNLTMGQECFIYKAGDFKPGEDILYIPDVALNELRYDEDVSGNDLWIAEIIGCCYTGDDFLAECHGNAKLAEAVFWFCDWQHPFTAKNDVEYLEGMDK